MNKLKSFYAAPIPRYRFPSTTVVLVGGHAFYAVGHSEHGHFFRAASSNDAHFVTHAEVSMMMDAGEIETGPVTTMRGDGAESAPIRDLDVDDMRRLSGRRPNSDDDPHD